MLVACPLLSGEKAVARGGGCDVARSGCGFGVRSPRPSVSAPQMREAEGTAMARRQVVLGQGWALWSRGAGDEVARRLHVHRLHIEHRVRRGRGPHPPPLRPPVPSRGCAHTARMLLCRAFWQCLSARVDSHALRGCKAFLLCGCIVTFQSSLMWLCQNRLATNSSSHYLQPRVCMTGWLRISRGSDSVAHLGQASHRSGQFVQLSHTLTVQLIRKSTV